MLTTQDVQNQISSLNAKTITPVPDVIRRLAQEKSFHIYNVGPYRWIQRIGSLGTWTIQPADEKTGISVPLKVPGMVFEAVTVDIGRQEQRPWDGFDVVKDIIGIGPYKSQQQDLTRWGIFYTEGSEPTKEQINEARKQLKARYAELVQEADGFQAQGPMQLQNITAEHRRAAAVLKLERDWSKEATEMMSCPGCGEKVVPGIVIHGGRYGCGWIFDKKKAIEGGLIAADETKGGK
jgi:hypothetical protein